MILHGLVLVLDSFEKSLASQVQSLQLLDELPEVAISETLTISDVGADRTNPQQPLQEWAGYLGRNRPGSGLEHVGERGADGYRRRLQSSCQCHFELDHQLGGEHDQPMLVFVILVEFVLLAIKRVAFVSGLSSSP